MRAEIGMIVLGLVIWCRTTITCGSASIVIIVRCERILGVIGIGESSWQAFHAWVCCNVWVERGQDESVGQLLDDDELVQVVACLSPITRRIGWLVAMLGTYLALTLCPEMVRTMDRSSLISLRV